MMSSTSIAIIVIDSFIFRKHRCHCLYVSFGMKNREIFSIERSGIPFFHW